ncbi:MAG: F0F1 ATP synthase subunit B [Clostridia bacterium]|nr:F0F1 ATP synthase subunit B [Clostridia bacterium]MBQ4638799.1 F0F1 ATP synthase subunit B [Clostridia bacterium]
MEGLFNPTTVLLHLFNAAILFVALFFLLYKPVRKFMQERSARIENSLKEAEEAKKAAEEIAKKGESVIEEAKLQAAKNIAEGAQSANERAQSIIDSANRQAEEIIEKAREEANSILNTTRAQMADEAAELAVEIAAAILEREVKAQDHKKLVDEFIESL